MKQLYIIRHAKSSWKDFSLDDFDRPLNKRGENNAPFMGKILKEQKILPDIIISSPALRAKTTALSIAKCIDYEANISFDKNIYEASYTTIESKLKTIDKKNNIVFLFGHNPGLNMFAYEYIGLYQNIPTCGIVKIEFDCNSWENISPSNAKLIFFDYPKKQRD